MSTDLHVRATNQRDLLADAAKPLVDELAEAQNEMNMRDAEPDTVTQSDWASDFGALQHEQVARAALLAVRAEQAAVRVRIAAIANPADAQTYEDELRELLVREAGLRVELRFAQERRARAAGLLESLSRLVAAAQAEVGAADARVAWAEQHTELATALRDALGTAPLSSVAADAAAVLADQSYADADARLDGRLPAELRARASERAAESASVVAAAEEADESVRTDVDARTVAARPDDGAVAVAERRLLEAERALGWYESTAAGRIAAAVAALERVKTYPALTAIQQAALAADNDRTTAADQESALASALDDRNAAQHDLDEAIKAALLADPDADPETVQAVIAARTALGDPGVQQPVTDARNDYQQAARDTLDLWEVEVPPDLWVALDDFLEAKRSLEELADNATVTRLRDALGAAEDALAGALTAHDRGARIGWALGLEGARRRAARLAATDLAGTRRVQYVQGDGPSGRLPSEL